MSLEENRSSKDHLFASDSVFDQLYPNEMRLLAYRHWTPLYVAKKAADFLCAQDKVNILDIGSGVGKFCMAAAHFHPNAFCYGVEQRQSLIEHAESVKEKIGLENVSFIQGNFTEIDFKKYDHFYFYNSFYENLQGTPKIDESLEYTTSKYHYYYNLMFRQLEKLPAGTKLATFHTSENDLPRGYHIVGADVDELLKYAIKI